MLLNGDGSSGAYPTGADLTVADLTSDDSIGADSTADPTSDDSTGKDACMHSPKITTSSKKLLRYICHICRFWHLCRRLTPQETEVDCRLAKRIKSCKE